MQTTIYRIAKNGGLVAGGLLIFGIMFAQIAQMWLMSSTPPRSGTVLESSITQKSGNMHEVASGMSWKLPLSMAAWGFLIMAGFETLAGIWRGNRKEIATGKPEANEQTKANDPEEMIQKLLKDMETNPTNLSNTPAPVGQLRINVPVETVG